MSVGSPPNAPDLDAVALAHAAIAAARSITGVAGISRGRYALARTYGGGGRVVDGVQLQDTSNGVSIAIHIVVQLVPILPLAAAVREAVARAVSRLGVAVIAVDVWIDALQEETGGTPG